MAGAEQGPNAALRVATLAACAVLTAFWIYAIAYLITSASPTGGGMELVAIVPMTVLFGALTVPAALTAWNNRRMTVPIILVLASAVANYLLWRQLLSELA